MKAYKGYPSTKPSILIQSPCHFRYFVQGREPPVLKFSPAPTNMTGETDRPGMCINPYPTAFPYGNGMVLHFYQQQESSTTKTVHKVINKGLKTYV